METLMIILAISASLAIGTVFGFCLGVTFERVIKIFFKTIKAKPEKFEGI